MRFACFIAPASIIRKLPTKKKSPTGMEEGSADPLQRGCACRRGIIDRNRLNRAHTKRE
jgi:hypothetical protein